MKKDLLLKMTGRALAAAATLAVFASCSDDGKEPEIHQGLEVALEGRDEVFRLKTGRTILFEPQVTNAADPLYSWTLDNRIVSTEKNYLFDLTGPGSYYLRFRAADRTGTGEIEVRVDVMDLLPPVITLAVTGEGYTIMTGQQLPLEPVVDTDGETAYEWLVNGTKVGRQKDYLFSSDEKGTYELVFRATNEDGHDQVEFPVHVRTPDEMPFSWAFVRTELQASEGRSIKIAPYGIRNAFDAEYTWTLDGQQVQQGPDPAYIFQAADKGIHTLTINMTNSYHTETQTLTVNVNPANAYFRAPSSGSSENLSEVFMFLPAPGQFTNERYSPRNQGEANTFAYDQLRSEGMISLGAFGGYVVVGFDHSIANDGTYNIQIKGNAFENSSEPGIVWVMQDENGDGFPNDTWYELAGSEYGKPGVVTDYEVTYYKPTRPNSSVAWTDNLGNSGTVNRNSSHTQESYYPLWVADESMTLLGTRLPSNISGGGTSWSLNSYGWGYVDNYSKVDMIEGGAANHFRICDAVDHEGRPVDLEYIDFVKVHTAVQGNAEWLGEVSTEVIAIKDYNLIKNNR